MKNEIRWAVLALSASILGASACSPLSTEISAQDYQTSCAINTDCVAIVTGDVCDSCGCEGAAINKGDEGAYERDVERATSSCSTDIAAIGCGQCIASRALCVDATCELLPVASIAAASFDTACVEDTDCVAVYEGAGCDTCSCANAAIARSALGEYQAAVEAIECGSTGVPCAADCAPPAVQCVSGSCQL